MQILMIRKLDENYNLISSACSKCCKLIYNNSIIVYNKIVQVNFNSLLLCYTQLLMGNNSNIAIRTAIVWHVMHTQLHLPTNK